MLSGSFPSRTMGSCDTSALDRNVAMARRHKITGTPALVFEDGKRIPGAMNLDQIEKQFAASKKS
jgi:thiol:disulfide interchange protein DsbC